MLIFKDTHSFTTPKLGIAIKHFCAEIITWDSSVRMTQSSRLWEIVPSKAMRQQKIRLLTINCSSSRAKSKYPCSMLKSHTHRLQTHIYNKIRELTHDYWQGFTHSCINTRDNTHLHIHLPINSQTRTQAAAKQSLYKLSYCTWIVEKSEVQITGKFNGM